MAPGSTKKRIIRDISDEEAPAEKDLHHEESELDEESSSVESELAGKISGHEESELNEESSDVESELVRKRFTKERPSKRTKTQESAKPTTTVRPRKRRQNLSTLLTLPLDILFEVFGHLSPKDNLNLLKTSKLFRDNLSSPRATTVWKEARQRAGVPDPPSFMSEIAWADLLFRIACQHCGAKNVQMVDFSLLRRLCVACKKAHLVVESRFKRRFPDEDKAILELLLYTNVSGWFHGPLAGRRFFWDQDVQKMIHELRAYELAILKHGVTAKRQLDAFTDERKNRIKEMLTRTPGYRDWFSRLSAERQKTTQELQKQRKEAIIERFLQLGYTEDDVEHITSLPAFQSTARLTDNTWKRIRPALEAKVMERKKRRLQEEFIQIKKSRKRVADRLYDKYKATLSPTEWTHLPGNVDVCELEPFIRVINQPADTKVTATDFDEAMKALPDLLQNIFDDRKTKLRHLALKERAPVAYSNPEDVSAGESFSVSVDENILNLATSIFQCSNERFGGHPRPFIIAGLEELMTHHCNDLRVRTPYDYANKLSSLDDGLSFSRKGSAIATSLIHLAGLDPQTALVFEIDGKDLRFNCADCDTRYDSELKSWVRVGFSWRAAIVHGLKNPHSKHSPSSDYIWNVLSEANANAVKASERADPKWDRPHWMCRHCSVYMTDIQERNVVIRHVENEHNVSKPKEPDDLFLFELFRSPFSREITYPVTQPSPTHNQLKLMAAKSAGGRLDFQCLRCESTVTRQSNSRRYDSDAIIEHFRTKHGTDEPQFGSDLREAP